MPGSAVVLRGREVKSPRKRTVARSAEVAARDEVQEVDSRRDAEYHLLIHLTAASAVCSQSSSVKQKDCFHWHKLDKQS